VLRGLAASVTTHAVTIWTPRRGAQVLVLLCGRFQVADSNVWTSGSDGLWSRAAAVVGNDEDFKLGRAPSGGARGWPGECG